MTRAPQARTREEPEIWIESDDGPVLENQDVLNTLETDVRRNKGIDAARGIVNGVIAGTILWILIIAAFVFF